MGMEAVTTVAPGEDSTKRASQGIQPIPPSGIYVFLPKFVLQVAINFAHHLPDLLGTRLRSCLINSLSA